MSPVVWVLQRPLPVQACSVMGYWNVACALVTDLASSVMGFLRGKRDLASGRSGIASSVRSPQCSAMYIQLGGDSLLSPMYSGCLEAHMPVGMGTVGSTLGVAVAVSNLQDVAW